MRFLHARFLHALRVAAFVSILSGGAAAWASPYSTAVLADNPLGYWRLGENNTGQPAADASGNGLHGAYAGSVSAGQPGAIAGDADTAASFSGGHVDVGAQPSLNLNNGFTIEAWLNALDTVNLQRLVGTRQTSPGSGGYGFGVINNRLIFTTFGVQDYITTNEVLSANAWQHVAVVFDATNDASFYVNGALVDTILGASPANLSTEPFFIGANPTDGGSGDLEEFGGLIDEVAVYGAALSPGQIQAHFAAVPEPSTLVLALAALASLAWAKRRRGR